MGCRETPAPVLAVPPPPQPGLSVPYVSPLSPPSLGHFAFSYTHFPEVPVCAGGLSCALQGGRAGWSQPCRVQGSLGLSSALHCQHRATGSVTTQDSDRPIRLTRWRLEKSDYSGDTGWRSRGKEEGAVNSAVLTWRAPCRQHEEGREAGPAGWVG